MSNVILDDFVYGSVFRCKGRAIGVQYSNVGETCAAVTAEGKDLIGDDLPSRTAVLDSTLIDTLAGIVRATGLARFVDFRQVNDALTGAGLDQLVKMGEDYLVREEAQRTNLDDAIMTMVITGKSFKALLYAEMPSVSPAVWDNDGIAICGCWWGFPTPERAVATLLELPSDSILVRL